MNILPVSFTSKEVVSKVGFKFLKSGKSNIYVNLFSNHYIMTTIYFKFDILLPKRFEATQASVCGPFPGPGVTAASAAGSGVPYRPGTS